VAYVANVCQTEAAQGFRARKGHPLEGGPISCVLADDHPVVLDSVGRLLAQRGIDVLATADNGEDALRLIQELKPDVAVLDIRMPRLTGIEVASKLHDVSAVPIVLYTGFGERPLLLEAMDVGIRAYVMKEAPLDDLVRAIRTVSGGGTYVDPVLAGELARGGVTDRVRGLSTREREVLRSASEGLTNEEIGERLFLSPDTVRSHMRHAMSKLEADSRTEAVATALRRHIIQ
jgi:DNA-binding NarL/FixJ family response regulator